MQECAADSKCAYSKRLNLVSVLTKHLEYAHLHLSDPSLPYQLNTQKANWVPLLHKAMHKGKAGSSVNIISTSSRNVLYIFDGTLKSKGRWHALPYSVFILLCSSLSEHLASTECVMGISAWKRYQRCITNYTERGGTMLNLLVSC